MAPPRITELGVGDFDAALDLEELLGLGLPATASETTIEDLLAQGTRDEPAHRCLDTNHPADCTKCRPPPAGDDGYALVADEAGSGNKRLRTLLLLTPEWADDDARLAAAQAAHAASLPALSEVLRQRAGRRLNKSWCLFLCRLWRFRSNLWVTTDEHRQRKRQRMGAERDTAVLTTVGVALPVARAPSLSASMHLLQLETKAQCAAFLLSAPGYRAASALTGCGGFQLFGLGPGQNMHTGLSTHLRAAAARLLPRLADQVAWHVEAERRAGGASPGGVLYESTHADVAIEQHRFLVNGAVALMRRRRAEAGPPTREWPQSLTVLFEEIEMSVQLMLEVSTTCEAMLREQRGKGDLSFFSEVGLGIMRLLAAFYVSVADSLATRDQWSLELMQTVGLQPLPTGFHTLVIRPDVSIFFSQETLDPEADTSHATA